MLPRRYRLQFRKYMAAEMMEVKKSICEMITVTISGVNKKTEENSARIIEMASGLEEISGISRQSR